MAESQIGLTVLHQPFNPSTKLGELPSTVFDIVAIHGLNGHPLETWTHRQTKVMWLKDLLPDEVPNTRIMTFGYDARLRYFTGHQDLQNVSLKLLSELAAARQHPEEVKRPILFVCHSLGGAVAKKALLISPATPSQSELQNAVYGIVFLATPNTTDDPATTAKLLSNIVSVYSPMKRFGSVTKEARVLYEISSQFKRQKSDLRFLSFYETKETSLGLFKKLVVKQGVAQLGAPDEDVVGQNATHRDIATFSGKHDSNFRPVVSSLVKWLEDFKLGSRNSSNAGPVPAIVRAASIKSTKSEIHGPYYEIPFPPCETFRGREDILEDMETYFNATSDNKQRTWVLSGLGGCGKTHTALQYAQRNRLRYKNGVFFFNASSKDTLVANFQRFIDLLKLSSAKSKTDALKRWFQKPENSSWLLIFDNADSLDAATLNSYIPVSTHGHIIVTTRQQAAIGQISNHGVSMEPLDEDSAIEVFVAKADIKAPSLDDVEQIREIVKLLGCLPFAVELSASFVRTQMKPLREYRALCQEKIYGALMPKQDAKLIADSYLTVWHVNFLQVEKKFPMAANLLLLTSFLECTDIPESMLRRGCSDKKVWDREGELSFLSPEDAGIRKDLIDLITNDAQLDVAIEELLAFSLIKPYSTKERGRIFSVHPLVQYCASQRVPTYQQRTWRRQAVLLICQAFPFSTYVDEAFGDKGREMIAHVPRILEEYDMLAATRHFPVAHERNVSIMLLASVKFSDLKWKREAVRRAKELVLKDNDAYLRGWLGVIESNNLRGQGNLSGSVSALENHIRNTTVPGLDAGMESDARFNAQRGELTLSYAETLLREGKLEIAKAELEAWKPLNPGAPSSMEKIVVQSRDNLLGRLLKDAGRFDEALPIFESLLRDVGPVSFVSTGWQLVMLNGLSELYCEIGRPLDGEIVLKQQMELIYQRKWESLNTGRRLQLAMIESFVRRGDFEEAESRLENLRVMFDGFDEMDEFQKTQHLRVWIGFAQIAHLRKNWNQASVCWDKALVITESSGWTSTFNHAVILFSLAQVLYQLGDKEEAANQLEIAEASFKAEGKRYWMVGMGSYWFDYVHVPLGEFGPEVVVHQISPSLPPNLAVLFERPFTKSPNLAAMSPAMGNRSMSLPERPVSRAPSPSRPAVDRWKSDPEVESKEVDESLQPVQLPKSALELGGFYPTDASGSQAQAGAMMFAAPGNEMMGQQSKAWFERYKEVEAFLDSQKIPDWNDTADPVRIAVLDTGVRWENAFMRQNDSRIVAENFVVDAGVDDIDGHGTDVIGILLRMTRNATVYSAKIADTKANPDLNAIEEAIDYAINEWRVNIISMSFGFDETHEGVRRALQRAHSANIIMFAAGHNDGANRPIAFPANSPLVIAVGAANAYGKDSSFSPAPPNKEYYFTAFGENIYNFGREKSGTSFATPVAAGIAALVMDYVNCLTNENATSSIPPWMVAQGRREEAVLSRIRTIEGMAAVLRLLSQNNQYLAPWNELNTRDLEQVPAILIRTLRR